MYQNKNGEHLDTKESGHEHEGKHKHAHDGGHTHGHAHTAENIGLAFFINLLFTVIELVGGVFTNSIAIISDSVHDFGDSLSLGLAWYFQKVSQKSGDRQYTYGYKRFSLLGAIINSVVLLVGSVYILTEAIPRLVEPKETNATGMFILAIVGIAVNGLAALRTRKGASINERVVSLHMLEDVLGWAAVLVGSIIMHFTGFTIIDPILSVLIALFVIINVFRNVKQVLPILLQGAPADIDREHILADLKKIPNIDAIHDLHIWALDEEYNVLTMHVVLKNTMPMGELAQMKNIIRTQLEKEGVQHATIEFEEPSEACTLERCN